jgi:hypothetical protein
MKINEIEGLWCATNIKEDFTILVVALEEIEAKEIAIGYFDDSNMSVQPDEIKITKFTDLDTQFDCDYVVG